MILRTCEAMGIQDPCGVNYDRCLLHACERHKLNHEFAESDATPSFGTGCVT